MNRKYLASLGVAATLILGVGLIIKPNDTLHDAVPGLSETVPLQQMTQEGGLRSEAGYFAERIAATSEQVSYVSETGASGILWAGVAGVVTASSSGGLPVAVGTKPATADTVRAAQRADRANRPRWVLVVGRTPNGGTVSTVGLFGGVAGAHCGQAAYEEMIVSSPLPPVFAGAGVYDLAGKVLGLVVRCDGRMLALPATEVDRVLAQAGSTVWRLQSERGIQVAPLDSVAARLFGSRGGMMVTEVVGGSAGASWGLRPGDVVEGVNGRPVADINGLTPLLHTPVPSGLAVAVRRGGRVVQVDVSEEPASPSASPGSQIRLVASSAGTTVSAVSVQSAAFRAGLRAGDIVVEAGGRSNPGVDVLTRILEREDTAAVFLIVRRGSSTRGILLVQR